MPAALRQQYAEYELHDIFNTVDTNSSGDVSMDEYFLWTLSCASETGGCGLEEIFAKYDGSGEGTLDAAEFAHAVEDMGFGSLGHDLFLELDTDEGGSISYAEIIKMLQDRTVAVGKECKRFLTAMAFESPATIGVDLDTHDWILDAKDHESLRKQIQGYLLDCSAKVSDLFNLMTDQGRKTLNKPQFLIALYEMGYEGDPEMVKDLFDEFDVDDTGMMSMEELYSWMNGKLHRSKMARNIHFGMRKFDATPLNRINWTPGAVRTELQRVLILHGLSPIDMMRGWTGKDGKFDKREFLDMMKKIVNDDAVWDRDLKDVCKDTYRSISGGDKDVDVIEFERWLNRGWLKEKAAYVESIQVQNLSDDLDSRQSASDAVNVISILGGVAQPGLKTMLEQGESTGQIEKRNSILLGRKLTLEEEQFNAACVLQRNTRSFQFRQRATLVVAQEMTEAKAAIMIQSIYRAKKARRIVAKRRQDLIEHVAATRLQTGCRVMLARKEKNRRLEARKRKQNQRNSANADHRLVENAEFAFNEPGAAIHVQLPDDPRHLEPLSLAAENLAVHLSDMLDVEKATVVITATGAEAATALVPRSSLHARHHMTFDNTCQKALPLKVEAPQNVLGPIMTAAQDAVKMLTVLEGLHDDFRVKSTVAQQPEQRASSPFKIRPGSPSSQPDSPTRSLKQKRRPGSPGSPGSVGSPGSSKSASPKSPFKSAKRWSQDKVMSLQQKKEHRAAASIQAVSRGYQSRRDREAQEKAAILLQTRMRGRIARKTMMSRAGLVAARLREVNDETSAHVLKVMREGLGSTFVEKFLSTRIDKVQASVDERCLKRGSLEALNARLLEDDAALQHERQQITQLERDREAVMEKAKQKVVEMEEALSKVTAANKLEFQQSEGNVVRAREELNNLEHALFKLETRSTGGEQLDKERIDMRLEVMSAKSQLGEKETELMVLRKRLLDGPRKDIEDQQKRVQQLVKDQARKSEADRKRKKVNGIKTNGNSTQRREIEAKRFRMEKEFVKTLLEHLTLDRNREERILEGTLLQQLRGSGYHGQRRYARGQKIVVRVTLSTASIDASFVTSSRTQQIPADSVSNSTTPSRIRRPSSEKMPTLSRRPSHENISDASTAREIPMRWEDATVESYVSGEHVCTLDVDGSQHQLVLHPFNHGPRLQSASEWERHALDYTQYICNQHSTVLDLLTGQSRELFDLEVVVTAWGAWEPTKSQSPVEEAKAPATATPVQEYSFKESMKGSVKSSFKGSVKRVKTSRMRPFTAPRKAPSFLRRTATAAAFSVPTQVRTKEAAPATADVVPFKLDFTAADLCEVLHKANRLRSDGKCLLEEPLIALITSAAATGKTCLMSQLATLAAAQGELVPIRVRVTQLHARLMNPDRQHIFASSWNWIDAFLRIEFGQTSDRYAMLRQAMTARRTLLLIDGIDEGGCESSRIRRHIIDVLAPQGFLCVVTSRPSSTIDRSWPACCLRAAIAPLTVEQQREVVATRLHTGNARTSFQQWRDGLGVRISDTDSGVGHAVTANPLMLSLLLSIMEHRQGAGDANNVCSMPSTLTELFELTTKLSYEAGARDRKMDQDAVYRVQNILETIAFEAHGANQREINENSLVHAVRAMMAHSAQRRSASTSRRNGLPVEVDDAVQNIKAMAIRGSLPLITLLQAEPFEMMFSHLSIQEFMFAKGVARGLTFSARMEAPWNWTARFANSLEFGCTLGEDFGKALYFGCAEGSDHLLFNLETRLNPHNDRPTGLSKSTHGATKNLISACNEAAPPSIPPTEDRTVLLRATALMSKHCVNFNVRANRLGAHEVALLAKGWDPAALEVLNLNENPIGEGGIQTVVDALLARGASQCGLRSLMLRDCDIQHGQGVKPIVQFVSVMSTLMLLDVRRNDLSDKGMYAIGNALLNSTSSKLSYLRCDAFDLEGEGKALTLTPAEEAGPSAVLLAGALKCNTVLQSLSIVDCKCNLTGARALCESLRHNVHLRALELTNVILDDNGVSIVSSALMIHPAIREMSLNNCNFGDGGAASLARNVTGNVNLRKLCVCNNRIREVGIKLIAEAAMTLKNIRTLRVDGNGFGAIAAGRVAGPLRGVHAQALAELICNSRSLTRLDIWHVGLRDDDIFNLGEALLATEGSQLGLVRCDSFDLGEPTTTELHLREQTLTSRVGPLLGGIVMRNTALTNIDLQSNSLGDNGAIALARGLERASLKKLNLAHNFIRVDGLCALAHGLNGNDALAHLNLSNNQVCGVAPDGSGRHSCAGLRELGSNIGSSVLAVLNLSCNRLEAAGAKALAAVVRNGGTLTELNVINNNLSFFGRDTVGVMMLVTQARHSDVLQVLKLNDNHLNGQVIRRIKPRKKKQYDEELLEIFAERCVCHYCAKADAEAKERGIATDPDPNPFTWKPSGWRTPPRSPSPTRAKA